MNGNKLRKLLVLLGKCFIFNFSISSTLGGIPPKQTTNSNGFFQYWLDRDKPMSQQIGLSANEPLLRFMVKFYIPDPSQLEEEYTRYLFSLQIKRDLAQGHLQCNDNTAALMASYIVQGEHFEY